MNILYVTYYYLPCNVIACKRIISMVNTLANAGHSVEIITRHWEEEDNSKTLFNETSKKEIKIIDNVKINYLPFLYNKKQLKQYSLGYKLNVYWGYLIGNFKEVQCIEKNFKPTIVKYCTVNNYDAIIYSCNPFEFINLSYKIFKQNNIPYIIDMRDLISINFHKKNPSLFYHFFKSITFFHIQKKLKNAFAILSVSEPMKTVLDKLSKKNTHVVKNGYTSEIDLIETNKMGIKKFTISFIGNIQSNVDYSIFINAINVLVKNNSTITIQINLIGTNQNYVDDFKNKLHTNIEVVGYNWVPYKEALQIGKESEVLLIFPYLEYTGIYSGKIFDYLGLQRNILACPSDNDVINDLIQTTNAGKCSSDVNEIYTFLQDWYDEWEKTGKLSYHGNQEEINKYSRSNQNKIVLEIINSIK